MMNECVHHEVTSIAANYEFIRLNKNSSVHKLVTVCNET